MALAWISFLLAVSFVGQTVQDFALPDCHGVVRRLSDYQDNRLVVVVFQGTDCPLAALYAPRLNALARDYKPKGIVFLGINSNQDDSNSRIAQYVNDHAVAFPILKDEGSAIAERFGATRTPECFVLDDKRVIRYRGRIDDQYEPGLRRPTATRRQLAEALDDLLANRPVRTPHTEAKGCFIAKNPSSRNRVSHDDQVTYSRQIAPILEKRCVTCHRPGQIGPFSLTTYKKAAAWSGTMREAIQEGRMPPWHADPAHGQFANDRRMPDAEKRLVYRWIEGGTPEGDPKDLPPPVVYRDDWRIAEPHVVVSMPEPFNVPAEGTVGYQYFEVDPGFTEDKWVTAADVQPGNRRVVHHCLIFLRPPGSNELSMSGPLNSVWLTTWVPGSPPLVLPPGMAKRIPAGWKLVFQMHYTTAGTPQTDQSKLGLVFVDPKTVKHEVATNMALDMSLKIPPRAASYRVEAGHKLPNKVFLLSFAPHMHVRGKSFRYDAQYPDGTHETLLDVPRYDFNWQSSYVLATPKLLPKGTVIHCTAQFDNSAANPTNPNPDAEVQWGTQTEQEMMIGYFDVALAEPPGFQLSWQLLTYGVILLLGALWLGGRWRRHQGDLHGVVAG